MEKCKHEWESIETSHTINDGMGEKSVIVIEVCRKCDGAQKKVYQFVNPE